MFSETRSIQFKAPRIEREDCFRLGFKFDGRQHFGGKRYARAKYFPRKVVESHEKPKFKKQVPRDSISPHNFNILYKNKICGTFLPLFTVPLTICDDQ